MRTAGNVAPREAAVRTLATDEIELVSGAATIEFRLFGFTYQFGDNGWAIWERGKKDPIATSDG